MQVLWSGLVRACWLCCAFVPTVLTAQQTNRAVVVEQEPVRPILNTQYGFRIQGTSQADQFALQGLTLRAFREVPRRLKIKLPNPEDVTLRIVAESRGAPNGRNVSFSQYRYEGTLVQKIWIWDVDSMDPEDFLEACSWAVLNRYLNDRRRPGSTPHQVPDWLAVGMAQSIYDPVKIRNGRVISDLILEGPLPSLDQVLRWNYLPQGRWAEKAVSAFLVKWLWEFPARDLRFDAMLSALAAGEPADVEMIAGFLPGFAEEKEARKAWEAWAERHRTRVVMPGTLSLASFAEARKLHVIPPSTVGVPTNVVKNLVLEDLIVKRKDDWVKPVAEMRANQFSLMSVARGSEFKGVMEQYRTYLLGLSGRHSDEVLEMMLKQAHERLAVLEALTRKRQGYLDGIEDSLGFISAREMREWYWPQGTPERSATQKYIDQYERQF